MLPDAQRFLFSISRVLSMVRRIIPVIIILAILISAILVAACTSAPSGDTAAQATAQTSLAAAAITTPPPGQASAKYGTGDIVRSAKGDQGTGWLVIKYDAGTDNYERAFIYRNSDGAWGYRVDASTEKVSRLAFEKVNTVKVKTVTISSIPTSAPTPTATTAVAATTAAPSTTATLGNKPMFKGIDPDTGMAGTSVSITGLSGNYFAVGATVKLSKTGSPDILATGVSIQSPEKLACTISLPANATTGPWDIIVTNPDGQFVKYMNGFIVKVNPNPVTTTTTGTTTTASTGTITITSLDPAFAPTSNMDVAGGITIVGSNFKDRISAKLTKSGNAEIPARECSRSSDTTMKCFFFIPQGSYGSWDLVLTNTDGSSGTKSGAFTVNG
jgi:starvation-inducible outer membrane lipoprotein